MLKISVTTKLVERLSSKIALATCLLFVMSCNGGSEGGETEEDTGSKWTTEQIHENQNTCAEVNKDAFGETQAAMKK